MLEHLLRGSGLTGLCGMLPVSKRDGLTLYRPLLIFSRVQLRQFLQSEGLIWREDASNADPRYLRNALRLDILPRLEALSPGVSARLAATAGILQADEKHLAEQAGVLLTRAMRSDGLLALEALLPLDDALLRRVLRLWWLRIAPDGSQPLTQPQTDALCLLVRGRAGGVGNLPDRGSAHRGYRYLHPIWGGTMPVPSGPVAAEDGACLCGVTLRLTEAGTGCGDGRLSQVLPADLLRDCVLRTRRPGDVIRPFGSSGTQSLQDYFVNRKLDAPFRDRVPLLARGSQVLLVCGVGAGAIPRMDNISRPLVRLCWEGDIPWGP